jgi:hypothetical protein
MARNVLLFVLALAIGFSGVVGSAKPTISKSQLEQSVVDHVDGFPVESSSIRLASCRELSQLIASQNKLKQPDLVYLHTEQPLSAHTAAARFRANPPSHSLLALSIKLQV